MLLLEKTKTSKEEARESQLKEESLIRRKVMSIQHNISLMLKALGEMAIANPIFTHSQLPSSVSFSFLRKVILSLLDNMVSKSGVIIIIMVMVLSISFSRLSWSVLSYGRQLLVKLPLRH